MQSNLVKIFTDGGARGNPGPGAASFVVIRNSEIIYQDKKYLGVTTNNTAEYAGVLMAMYWLSENADNLNTSEISFYLDSQLVARQLQGAYRVKDNNLRNYFEKIKKIESSLLIEIAYIAVPREQNKNADMLVNAALDEK